MSTNASQVASVTLQKLIDGIIASIKFNSGASPAAAPNAFKNHNQEVITVESSEFKIEVTVNPGGNSAYAKVMPIGSMASCIEGQIDLTTLATKLV